MKKLNSGNIRIYLAWLINSDSAWAKFATFVGKLFLKNGPEKEASARAEASDDLRAQQPALAAMS